MLENCSSLGPPHCGIEKPMVIDHPLMRNNITRQDLDKVIDYLRNDDPKLTQGENVDAFENEWSEWLGVKHSVFVNSGSSANLITLAVLKELYGQGEVIVPPLTWVSDIAACLQNGFEPIFADINPQTLSLDTDKVVEKITNNTKAVFLTHAQGFNGLTDQLLTELKKRKIPLLEDVCESHGATFRNSRLGSFGLISNFSFYYAHHMSTIEGGMVCTDDETIYQLLRMYRSHGMVRESTNQDLQQNYVTKNSSLNPEFIFAFPAYNVRNTEIGAIIGRSQFKNIDERNKQRRNNHNIFLESLDPMRFRTEFNLESSCNYAFNIILSRPDLELRDYLERQMENANIEFRRDNAGGENQLRQPYLRGTLWRMSMMRFTHNPSSRVRTNIWNT